MAGLGHSCVGPVGPHSPLPLQCGTERSFGESPSSLPMAGAHLTQPLSICAFLVNSAKRNLVNLRRDLQSLLICQRLAGGEARGADG